jgi:peptidase E
MLYVTSNSFINDESEKKMERILTEKKVKKILIIDDAEPSYISGTLDYFDSLGIECKTLTLSKTDEEEVKQLIDNASVIYLSGGNPFPLAKEIKRFKASIKEKVFSFEDIVIGASAGAMVLGEEFYLAELLEPGSSNGFSKEDEKGLNILFGKIFFPHCDEFSMPKEYEGNENIIYINKEDFYKLNMLTLFDF